MKTAMNELLSWVRKTLPMDLDTPRMIEDKIESLLEKEKEQICDSYVEGLEGLYMGAEEYYNKTFNK